MNIGVQSSASERYRIHHEASCDSRKTNTSMQFWPMEVQRALNNHAGFNLIYWLWLQVHPTLTVTCTFSDCIGLTRAFITIWSLCTPRIGSWGKSDIVWIWFVTNFRWELACHWLSRWAETGIQILYLFNVSWWKWVHTIYFEMWVFGGPNIKVSQNVVESALEGIWIQSCSRKSNIMVSGACLSSAESLRRCCLLRLTLSCCSSIMEPERQKLY
jgi:hypothetical protein